MLAEGRVSCRGGGGEGKGCTISVIYNWGQGRLHCLIIIVCRPLPIKGVAFTMQPPFFFSFFLLFFDMHLSQAGKQNNLFMDDLLKGSHMNHSTA